MHIKWHIGNSYLSAMAITFTGFSILQPYSLAPITDELTQRR